MLSKRKVTKEFLEQTIVRAKKSLAKLVSELPDVTQQEDTKNTDIQSPRLEVVAKANSTCLHFSENQLPILWEIYVNNFCSGRPKAFPEQLLVMFEIVRNYDKIFLLHQREATQYGETKVRYCAAAISEILADIYCDRRGSIINAVQLEQAIRDANSMMSVAPELRTVAGYAKSKPMTIASNTSNLRQFSFIKTQMAELAEARLLTQLSKSPRSLARSQY